VPRIDLVRTLPIAVAGGAAAGVPWTSLLFMNVIGVVKIAAAWDAVAG